MLYLRKVEALVDLAQQKVIWGRVAAAVGLSCQTLWAGDPARSMAMAMAMGSLKAGHLVAEGHFGG